MIPKDEQTPNVVRRKIKELEEENDVKFSTIQKILCSLEGPVVSILDVLYGDVNLFVLDQRLEKADASIAEKLEINEGDGIDLREAIAYKHGRPIVYGLSYIPRERCSNTVIEKLLKEEETTGRIILEHQIETVSKVLDIRIEKPDAKLQSLFHTNDNLLVREFSLIHKKKVVIWSKEAYPFNSFEE